jgi:hypothetical protein
MDSQHQAEKKELLLTRQEVEFGETTNPKNSDVESEIFDSNV